MSDISWTREDAGARQDRSVGRLRYSTYVRNQWARRTWRGKLRVLLEIGVAAISLVIGYATVLPWWVAIGGWRSNKRG